MSQYIYKSATELAQLIRDGQASSTDIVKAHLDRIKQYNPELNAVVISLEEEALQTAKACDEEAKQGKFRGPLHGLPMTIKEQFWIKGVKATLNFKMLKDEGGIPAHENQRSIWDERDTENPNPEYR